MCLLLLLLLLNPHNRINGEDVIIPDNVAADMDNEGDFIDEVVSTMKDWVSTAKEPMERVSTMIQEEFETIGDQTMKLVDVTIENIGEVFDDVPGGVGESLRAMTGEVNSRVTEVYDSIQNREVVSTMSDWVSGFGYTAQEPVKRVSRMILGEIDTIRNQTMNLVDDMIENIEEVFDDVPSGGESFRVMTGEGDSRITEVYDSIQNRTEGVAGIVTNFYKEMTSEDDNIEQFWDNDSSIVGESFRVMTGAVNSRVGGFYDSIQNRSQSIADAVTDIYSGMTSDVENYRFEVILEQITPDFSPYYYICPMECLTCNETSSEIVCRFCCPDLFTEPISFTSVAMETGYSQMVGSWLLESIAWTGLKPVFQSWLDGNAREQHDVSGELKALIRNFHWLQQAARGKQFPVVMHTDNSLDSDNEDDFDILPDQVCGYYEDSDLRRPEGRVMGGEEVERTRQYPWQMSLATGFMGMFYQHRCGAALIADRWALSAAHCLHTLGGETLYVMGGFLDINNKETAQIKRVETYFSHENFVPRLYEQDIALLRLQSPVVFTPSLLPVCLPSPSFSRQQEYSSNLGQTAVLAGWGRQWDDGPLSGQLEMVELPVISNTMCMDWYNMSGSRQYIPEHTFLCAGWEGGKKDACSGDSGGPLVVRREEDGRAEVIGVVSWGIGCGVKGRPGVYTRVSQFVPWIKRKIMEYRDETY